MDLERRNRDYFKTRDPHLLKDLESVEGMPSMLLPSPGGDLTLVIGNHAFHDPHDPQFEAKAMVGNSPGQLHVHFGFGLGYFLEAEKTLPGGHILIFEPNPDFIRQAFRHRSIDVLFKGRSVSLFVDLGKFSYALMKHRTETPTYTLFVSAHHASFFKEEFQQFQQVIQRPPVLPAIAEMPIMPQILRSTIRSMPYYVNKPGFQQWRGRLENRAAVIVAAGPSLEKNLGVLAANRNKVIIFAIARSAPILAEYGVSPDFLVHVEAQNYHYLIQNCPNLGNTTFLLADQAQDLFYLTPHQKTFVFRSLANHLSNCLTARFPQIGNEVIKTGGSVATAALYLAFLAGCNPLIIAGQDFATLNEQQYAGQHPNNHHRPTLMVDGYFGGKVATFPNYNNNIVWYKHSVPALKTRDADREFINATEGGADLEPVGREKLAAVLNRLPIPSGPLNDPPDQSPPKVDWQSFLSEGRQLVEEIVNQRALLHQAENEMLETLHKSAIVQSPRAEISRFSSLFAKKPWWRPLFKRELTMAEMMLQRYESDMPIPHEDLLYHWATLWSIYRRIPELVEIMNHT